MGVKLVKRLKSDLNHEGSGAIERKIELKFVEPGSPYQNGYVERFNKAYREEVLDAFTFRKLGEATALTQAWLWMYNNERPH